MLKSFIKGVRSEPVPPVDFLMMSLGLALFILYHAI